MSKLSFKKNIGIIRFTIWSYFISFKQIFIKKKQYPIYYKISKLLERRR